MKQATRQLTVSTQGKGLYDFTSEVAAWVHGQAMRTGLLTVFLRHTSASLTIQENADPDVIADLNDFFGRLVSEDPRLYRHTSEGPDDMPAHIKASLLGPSLAIPIARGRLALGTWQGVYLCEHRDDGGRRSLIATLCGQPAGA